MSLASVYAASVQQSNTYLTKFCQQIASFVLSVPFAKSNNFFYCLLNNNSVGPTWVLLTRRIFVAVIKMMNKNKRVDLVL